MSKIKCMVVTPEKTSLEEWTEFVVLQLYDGEIGIAAGHAPLIGRVGFGEMRLRTGDKVTRYYVDGGFVQVAENVVTILTRQAVPAGDLDASAARQQLIEARARPATTPAALEIRERLVAQARAQLRMAGHN
ncbi:MAG: ATP synthase F1 subunit epsilon [Planctomycetota bacterium]|nr:ATP synthase F1 subunit epsilon [Planctomycetota bacterium]